MESVIGCVSMGSVSWPNVSAHRHGDDKRPQEGQSTTLEKATEEVHDAVFGAAPCSGSNEDFTGVCIEKQKQNKLPTCASRQKSPASYHPDEIREVRMNLLLQLAHLELHLEAAQTHRPEWSEKNLSQRDQIRLRELRQWNADGCPDIEAFLEKLFVLETQAKYPEATADEISQLIDVGYQWSWLDVVLGKEAAQ